MSYLDIFFGVILLLGAVKGYMKGFIVELFALVAFFIGLFIAISFSIPVTEHFFSDSDYSGIISIIVFIVLFVLLSIIINLVAKVIKKVVDLTFLGFFDNILGALAAMFKWALILSIVFWIFDTVGIQFPEKYTSESAILPFIKPIGPITFSFIADVFPFLKEILDSMEGIRGNEKLAEISLSRIRFV